MTSSMCQKILRKYFVWIIHKLERVTIFTKNGHLSCRSISTNPTRSHVGQIYLLAPDRLHHHDKERSWEAATAKLGCNGRLRFL
jgi:hypothetical protein